MIWTQYLKEWKLNLEGTCHKDLPLPVAMTIKESLPAMIFSITSSWYGRNEENPKYCYTQNRKWREWELIYFTQKIIKLKIETLICEKEEDYFVTLRMACIDCIVWFLALLFETVSGVLGFGGTWETLWDFEVWRLRFWGFMYVNVISSILINCEITSKMATSPAISSG